MEIFLEKIKETNIKVYNLISSIESEQVNYLSNKDDALKKEFGQYFSGTNISIFMASLIRFDNLSDKVDILDSGAGHGMLTIAACIYCFYSENSKIKTINASLYEVDNEVIDGLKENIRNLKEILFEDGYVFNYNIINDDFVTSRCDINSDKKFDFSIINPPYFKYSAKDSKYSKAVKDLYKGDPNIYSSFMAIALNSLKSKGQLIAITPRSYLNGLYFKGFRKYLLENSSLDLIHIFSSRNETFREYNVLQENIIAKYTRDMIQSNSVVISQSKGGNDLTEITTVTYEDKFIIDTSNDESIIRVIEDESSYKIIVEANNLPSTFSKEGYFISTGPVVEHRTKKYLSSIEINSVPLIKSHNVDINGIKWPGNKDKDLFFKLDENFDKHLLPNNRYVILKRFTSKDENRRLFSSVYTPINNINNIGITNKLNYLGLENENISNIEAIGLSSVLNSSFFDNYYRCISGNTQVNATDIRIMKFFKRSQIREIGSILNEFHKITLSSIDEIVNRYFTMSEKNTKLQEAKDLLKAFGLPPKQTNDRSAWTFLALANIKPDDNWSDCKSPLLPTVDIMSFIRDNYGMDYKPNSRETIRRQTLHQFEQARIVDRNRDDPSRSTNSAKNNYSLNKPILEILKKYPNGNWSDLVSKFIKNQGTLTDEYKKVRDMVKIPVLLPDGTKISLSPGAHNQLHADIINEFCALFIKSPKVLYIGDTASSRIGEGGKMLKLDQEYFKKLGVPPMAHDKLPDVVVYDEENQWLFLIEAVTSHGPVSPKRYKELEIAIGDSVDKVYVTAFPNRSTFKRHVADIAWETEVWIADNPTHMIHFNGDKFLGPHAK